MDGWTPDMGSLQHPCCLLQDPPCGWQSLRAFSSPLASPFLPFLKGSQPFSPAAAFKLRP